MSKATRREVLGRSAAGAIGAILALNSQPVFAAGQRSLTAPTRAMHLTRTITRGLVDGQSIIVARSWRVRFAAEGDGWAVTGSQEDVGVMAPSGLESLARIETNRPAREAFPIRLDCDGLIIQEPASSRRLDMDEVARAAHQSITARGGGGDKRGQLQLFLAQLQQTSASLMSTFPQDLFFPMAKPQREKRSMELPGGLIGEMELTYAATARPISGLLDSSERMVVTRIEGEELRSSETWDLSDA